MPRVKTDHGVTLYYESIGEGPPLILHAHHHRMWMYAQAPFLARYFQVIAYDRRGTGRSDCPSGEWTQEDLSRDCAGLMDALGLDKAIIAGWSTGGLITIQVGVDYPDRVSALIQTNSTWWMWPVLQRQFYAPILEALDAGASTTEEILDLIARTPVRSFEWESSAPELYGEEYEPGQLAQLLAVSAAMNFGNTREGLRSFLRLNSRWDLRPREKELRELQVPTLIMVGNEEPTHLIGNAWELHNLIPGAEFVLLKGSHMSPWEQAVRYNTEILNFLDRHGLVPSPAP